MLEVDQTHVPKPKIDDPFSVTQWTDSYLSRSFIFLLVLSFLFMIMILECMNHLSNLNHGIASVNEDWYYLWTYGPTMSREKSPPFQELL